MGMLKNYTIRAVMLVVLGFLCVLWASVGAWSVYSLSNLSKGNELDRQLVSQINVLSKGNDQYFRFVTRLSRVMSQQAAGGVPDAAALDNVRQARDNFAQLLARFKAMTPGPMDAQTAQQVIADWQKLLDNGVVPQFELARQGISDSYQHQAFNVTPALSRSFGSSAEKFNRAAEAMLDDTRYQVDYLTSATRTVIVVAVLVGLLVLLLTDRYLVTWLVKPLRRIRSHFSLIAGGDLSQPVEDLGRNCVGQLVPLLNEMQNQLREAVCTIRSGSDNIWRGATEISTGNNSLSSRTEQQAAALEETAASMEQLTSTVTLNADNAREASTLASAATVAASEGGRLVSDVISTMQGISDSSKKIADITSVINGIAFQTNILALNAAVEAARAGEQGRGFAVVAGEVRNLAQRSADAAKEIETLIADSVARVTQGATLVDKTGTAMETIVTDISNVSEIIKQIASASAEQSKGISQIGIAITQMDTVTQQNASLVEEIATAAVALEQQTGTLQNAVQRFRLSGE